MPGDCSFYVTVQMFNIGKKIKKNKNCYAPDFTDAIQQEIS